MDDLDRKRIEQVGQRFVDRESGKVVRIVAYCPEPSYMLEIQGGEMDGYRHCAVVWSPLVARLEPIEGDGD